MLSIIFNSNFAFAESVNYNVIIDPSLTISLTSNLVTLDLNPVSKPFDNSSTNVLVSTNNATGYYMTMSTTSGNTNLVNNNSTPGDITDDSYIETLPSSGEHDCSSGCSEESFPVNKWGYKIGSTANYFPFTSGVTVRDTIVPAADDTTTLTFASKVDYDTKAGLYATTLNFTAVTKPVPVYMQYMTSSACTTTPRIVTDIRDNQEYLVQRLDDGKCWMLDNLRLDLTDGTIVSGLKGTDETDANTNATAEALGYLRNGGGSATDQWAMSGLSLSNWINNTSYRSPLINKSGSCVAGDSTPCTYTGTYTYNTVLSTLTPNPSTFGLGSGKIGIYYNYCAVTAGSYCYDSSGVNAGIDAEYDICPVNWRIPTGGDTGEYKKLYDIINNTTASDPNSYQYKLSMPFSGTYHGGSAHRQGTYGTSWSSTYRDANNMYIMASALTSVGLSFTGRNEGRSIRCLLQE